MNTEINEIKKLVDKVEGWLSDEEGELLYTLAKNCKGKGVIVEIGSWKGRSTIWLAKGSKAGNNVKIYAIDPHTGSPECKKLYGEIRTFGEFKKNIENTEVDDIVIPVVKTSEEVAENFNELVELVFVDGAHGYESVKLDFELWFPKLIDGGIMAFHDTIGWVGPKKVVEKYIYKSKNFRNVGFIGSITFAEKVKWNSILDRIENRWGLFLKSVIEFIGKFHLPKPLKIIGKLTLRIIQMSKARI